MSNLESSLLPVGGDVASRVKPYVYGGVRYPAAVEGRSAAYPWGDNGTDPVGRFRVVAVAVPSVSDAGVLGRAAP